jgi:hypothetical protein
LNFFAQGSIRLESWDSLLDPVECLLAAGKDLPDELSLDQANRIVSIGDALERLNYPDNLGGLLGGNLMTHILELMQNASKSPSRSSVL